MQRLRLGVNIDHVATIRNARGESYPDPSRAAEVAMAAGKDPVAFRLDLLAKAKTTPVGAIKYDIDRMKGVIDLAVEKSQWGK